MAQDVPNYRVDGQIMGRDAALAAFAAAVQDVFAVELVDAATARRPIDIEAWHLGTVMFGQFSGPPIFFDRSQKLVGQSGLDHILVQLYTAGGFEGTAGDAPILVGAGDICVFDLSETFSTRSTDFTNLSLLVPRSMIESALDDMSVLHGLVLSSTAPLAGILSEYVISLARRMPTLSSGDALVAALATVSLTTTILVGEARQVAQQSRSTGRRSPSRLVNDYIDRNIHDPDLAAEAIASALGMSRASLYRLLAGAGGVGRYIRRRRLSGAALELCDPTRNVRIGDVAAHWGFASDASFSRTFRQAFGIPPKAARERALAFLDTLEDGGSPEVSEQRFAYWMRTLRAARPAPDR